MDIERRKSPGRALFGETQTPVVDCHAWRVSKQGLGFFKFADLNTSNTHSVKADSSKCILRLLKT